MGNARYAKGTPCKIKVYSHLGRGVADERAGRRKKAAWKGELRIVGTMGQALSNLKNWGRSPLG